MNHIGLYIIYYCLIITYIGGMLEGGRDIYRYLKLKGEAPETNSFNIKYTLWGMFGITILFGIAIAVLEGIMLWVGIH